MIKTWLLFEVDTVGKQLVRCVDSIGANIAEGGHRQSDMDGLRFFVIARASGEEACYWLERIRLRCMEPETKIADLEKRLRTGLGRLEALIKYRRSRSSKR